MTERPQISGEDAPRAGPGFRRRFPIGALLLVYAAAVVAGAFFAPWHETWIALGRARLIWMAAGLGVCLAGAPVAATQWWLFVPRRYRLRWGRVFEITTLTSIARTVLPFFTGDLSALGLLVMRGGLDRGAALLVLGLDQLFTGIGKAALVCAAVVFAPLPASLATPGTTLIALVACALAAMLGAAHYRGSLDQLAAKSWPPLARAIRVIADLAQYLGLLRSPSRTSGALALTVVKKSIEISATLAIQHAVGIALPPSSALLVVTALNLATVIPGPPASLGVFEATTLFIYNYLGVPPGTAFAAAVLQHAIYLTPDIGYGYVVLLNIGRRSLRGDEKLAGD